MIIAPRHSFIVTQIKTYSPPPKIPSSSSLGPPGELLAPGECGPGIAAAGLGRTALVPSNNGGHIGNLLNRGPVSSGRGWGSSGSGPAPRRSNVGHRILEQRYLVFSALRLGNRQGKVHRLQGNLTRRLAQQVSSGRAGLLLVAMALAVLVTPDLRASA